MIDQQSRYEKSKTFTIVFSDGTGPGTYESASNRGWRKKRDVWSEPLPASGLRTIFPLGEEGIREVCRERTFRVSIILIHILC